MTVFYKTISTTAPGSGKDGKKIYYPKLTNSTQIDLNKIADLLEKRSSASRADIYLTIIGLVDLLPELLADGHTIKLGDMGIFRLHAKANTSESPEEVSSKNIQEVRLTFRADKRIKYFLKSLKFKKLEDD